MSEVNCNERLLRHWIFWAILGQLAEADEAGFNFDPEEEQIAIFTSAFEHLFCCCDGPDDMPRALELVRIGQERAYAMCRHMHSKPDNG